MWVRSLGWEDPLEEEIKTHSYILAWRIPMDRGAWRATDHGVTVKQTERLSTQGSEGKQKESQETTGQPWGRVQASAQEIFITI